MTTAQKFTQAAPTGNFGGAKYVVTWNDENGAHSVPYIQSWFARSEARTHIKAGYEAAIWILNKRTGAYEYSQLEMDKTLETIKPPEGPRTNGKVFELLSRIAVSATSLQRQAKKGSVNSQDYDDFRALIDELDVELDYQPVGDVAQ